MFSLFKVRDYLEFSLFLDKEMVEKSEYEKVFSDRSNHTCACGLLT